MAVAQVQKASTQPGAATSATATLGSTPTNGNKLIAFYRAQTASGNITPPAGWTIVATGERASLTEVIAYKDVSGDAAAVTFSTTVSVQQDLAVAEYSGLIAGTADKTNNAASVGTGTSQTSGTTAVTTQAAELVVAGIGLNGGAGGFANTWTNSFIQQAALVRSSWAHRIAAATAAFETTEGWTTTQASVGVIATFKAFQVSTTTSRTSAGAVATGSSAKVAPTTSRTSAAGLARGSAAKVAITSSRTAAGALGRGASVKKAISAAALAGGAVATGAATKVATTVGRLLGGALLTTVGHRVASWLSFEGRECVTSLDEGLEGVTSLDEPTFR